MAVNVATRKVYSNDTEQISVKLQEQKVTLPIDCQSVKKYFQFLTHTRNNQYESGIVKVPLRTCLLHNKVPVFEWHIKTEPKWLTDLLRTDFDTTTGEILGTSVYRTDDLTSGNNRKIKAVNRFVDHFKPLYRQKKVSLLFMTFSVANQARTDIKNLLHTFKKRLKRRNVKLHGYLWVLEISDASEKSSGLHVHYHCLVAIDRINCKGGSLPDYLKLNDVWGAKTGVEFVQSNSIKYYLSKYFVKCKKRIIGKRSYGMNIKNPTKSDTIKK